MFGNFLIINRHDPMFERVSSAVLLSQLCDYEGKCIHSELRRSCAAEDINQNCRRRNIL